MLRASAGRRNWAGAGAAAAVVVLIVLPLCSLLWGSIASDRGPTLAYFARVLSQRVYFEALINSLVLGTWTAALSVLIALPLAWAVARTDLPARNFVKLTATLSYLSPPFLLAIAYVNLFSPRAGVINAFVAHLIGSQALTFNIYSMPGLILVTVPHTFPFVYLLASSALSSIDASYEESARILGASRLRTMTSITFPLIAPAVLSGALISFVNAIALFGSQAIIGLPARIYTLPTRIYALFDYPPEYGLASALSLIFVAITVVALYVQRAYLSKRSYVTLAGKGARLGRISLGAWRWPILTFSAAVFIIAVLLPYGSLLAVSLSKSWGLDFWKNLTFANYAFVLFKYDVTRRAISNSLILATLAASSAIVLGLVIAWVDSRTQFRGRRFLDYVSMVPLGLPGIVMAAALLQFWLKVPLALYGTLAILFLAYAARYLPLGVRSANTALAQIDTSLEESARILGASWTMTLREITVPLMRTGLFAGWILIFVPAIQELSASILLFSSKSITLSVAVYNLYENGYIEPVAALALVNVAIIGAAILLANRLAGGTAFESSSQ